MDSDLRAVGFGLLLVLFNAYLVAAEYALVSVRKSRIESLAKRGNRRAIIVQKALDDMPTQIAGIQTAITLCGIGIGALLEPVLTGWLKMGIGAAPDWLLSIISVAVVALPLVVLGELVPKYATLRASERAALWIVPSFTFLLKIILPLVWLFKITGSGVLKLIGIDMSKTDAEVLSREELSLLLKAPESNDLDADHANVVSKALKLDQLSASDIMIHRVDMKWIKVDITRQELHDQLREVSHSRLVVCGEDLDDVRGIMYLQDLVRHWQDEDFALQKIIRPAEFVPETLNADKIVNRMRDAKTQIMIVRDEYGGTSGLLTLEDIVEEVFGDLEDSLEAERPSIERLSDVRLSIRADVRYDELLDYLSFEEQNSEFTTETLAEVFLEKIKRVPQLGETLDMPFGVMRVEGMVRRRITRIGLTITPRQTESA